MHDKYFVETKVYQQQMIETVPTNDVVKMKITLHFKAHTWCNMKIKRNGQKFRNHVFHAYNLPIYSTIIKPNITKKMSDDLEACAL